MDALYSTPLLADAIGRPIHFRFLALIHTLAGLSLDNPVSTEIGGISACPRGGPARINSVCFPKEGLDRILRIR